MNPLSFVDSKYLKADQIFSSLMKLIEEIVAAKNSV
jgi:hypothetical protein